MILILSLYSRSRLKIKRCSFLLITDRDLKDIEYEKKWCLSTGLGFDRKGITDLTRLSHHPLQTVDLRLHYLIWVSFSRQNGMNGSFLAGRMAAKKYFLLRRLETICTLWNYMQYETLKDKFKNKQAKRTNVRLPRKISETNYLETRKTNTILGNIHFLFQE